MPSNIGRQYHPSHQFFYLQRLVRTVTLQEIYLTVLLENRPQSRKMHLLKDRLIASLLSIEPLRLDLERIVSSRMVEIMGEGGDEDVEPLLLRESLSELLGTIIALIQKLNKSISTCSTEKA